MRTLFLGTGDIGLSSLRLLAQRPDCELLAVVSQPDRPAGRGMKLRESPIKTAALELGIPILQPEKIRQPEIVEQLRAFAPDLLIVMAYGQILPKSVLEIPKIAPINLHASLLPRHRGASPIQAAILAGDAESGITVMHMDVGLDTGDLILQKRFPLAPNETGGSLHDRLGIVAAEALDTALDLAERGQLPRIPQDSALATYAPKIEKEAGHLDWSLSADELDRKIRAYSPWPAAFTCLPLAQGESKTLRIFSANLVEVTGKPGEVLASAHGGILIASGTNALQLGEVQLEGRKRMSAVSLAMGHAPAIGQVCT